MIVKAGYDAHRLDFLQQSLGAVIAAEKEIEIDNKSLAFHKSFYL